LKLRGLKPLKQEWRQKFHVVVCSKKRVKLKGELLIKSTSQE